MPSLPADSKRAIVITATACLLLFDATKMGTDQHTNGRSGRGFIRVKGLHSVEALVRSVCEEGEIGCWHARLGVIRAGVLSYAIALHAATFSVVG